MFMFGKINVQSMSLFMWKRRMSYSKRSEPVKLAYSMYQSEHSDTPYSPLVIIHGLFGAKQNWQTLAKRFAQYGRQVIAVDLRNHGNSPHDDVMTYEAMCSDIELLLKDLGLEHVVLMGHSLGGKVAMAVALFLPSCVRRLIIVDVAPVTSVESGVNLSYAKFFKQVKLEPGVALHENRQSADRQLKNDVQDASIRSFALLNLIQRDNITQWRLNLDAIINNYSHISSFPQTGTTFHGPTKFIAGQNSNYISDDIIPIIQGLFPNNDIERVPNAGHWVHTDQPHIFIKIVEEFIKKK